jgi:hypothetical protein
MHVLSTRIKSNLLLTVSTNMLALAAVARPSTQVRCWHVPTMSAHGDALVTDEPVLALAASASPEIRRAGGGPGPLSSNHLALLFTGHEDGTVRCWALPPPASGGAHQVLWRVAHPGPVTALALHGRHQLVSASTCRLGPPALPRRRFLPAPRELL